MNTNSNKDKAAAFLQLAAAGNVREAYKKYVGPGFSHHNPFFPGDADSLINAMEQNASKNPDKTFAVKRLIEEGDLVAIHSHVKQNREDLGAAVVHLFRFENGFIAELWDVGQPIPVDSPNERGVF